MKGVPIVALLLLNALNNESQRGLTRGLTIKYRRNICRKEYFIISVAKIYNELVLHLCAIYKDYIHDYGTGTFETILFS